MLVASVFTPAGLLTRSGLRPIPLVLVVVALVAYGAGVGRLRAAGRAWPGGRSAAATAAAAVVLVATQSGLDGYRATDFSVTAVAQIGLFVVAPVLAALAAPLTLLLAVTAATDPRRADRIGRLVVGRPGRIVYHPLLTWVVYAGALAAAYVTHQYAWAARHAWAGQVTDVELLVVGCMWLWPVVGADPRPRRLAIGWRVGYLLLSFVYWSGLGLAIQSQQTRIAPRITLSDLHTGAGILWTAGALAAIAITIGVIVQWLAVDEGHARRADRVNADEDARQLAVWRADRRAAALADHRARDSVVVASRPAGTPDTDRSAASARSWRDDVAAIEARAAGAGPDGVDGDPPR